MTIELRKIYFATLGKTWEIKKLDIITNEYWMPPGIVRINLSTGKDNHKIFSDLIILRPIY